jgi:hypothetical protein
MSETISCVCPECGDINDHKFIHDSETIERYGFNASKEQPGQTSDEEWAPNGLCPNTTCIDDWCTKRNLDSRFRLGIPLIENDIQQSDSVELRYESAEECNDCNLGRFYYNTSTKSHQCDNPYCSAERNDLPPPESYSNSSKALGDKEYEFRSRYVRALGERKEVVDPPYLFEKAINPMKQNWNEKQVKIEQAELHTSRKRNQAWFTCLHPYLKELDSHAGTKFQKIVLSTYIDKTFQFRHIEPLWMFARRGNLGGELRTAFKMFNDRLETFSRVIKSHGYALENNLESIRCVYQLIQSLGSWPTDRIDDDKIIDEALKSMKKLDSKLKQLSRHDLMGNTYSLDGRIKTPIGLIECICIINALHHHSGIDNFANDVRVQIFPDRSKSEFWKEIMGEKSELFVNQVLPKLCSI